MSRVKQLMDRKQPAAGVRPSSAVSISNSKGSALSITSKGALLAWSHDAELVRRQSSVDALVVGNPDKFNFVSVSHEAATPSTGKFSSKSKRPVDRGAPIIGGQSWSAQNSGVANEHESDLLAILEERLQQQKTDLARSRSKLLGSVRSDIQDLSNQYEG